MILSSRNKTLFSISALLGAFASTACGGTVLDQPENRGTAQAEPGSNASAQPSAEPTDAIEPSPGPTPVPTAPPAPSPIDPPGTLIANTDAPPRFGTQALSFNDSQDCEQLQWSYPPGLKPTNDQVIEAERSGMRKVPVNLNGPVVNQVLAAHNGVVLIESYFSPIERRQVLGYNIATKETRVYATLNRNDRIWGAAGHGNKFLLMRAPDGPEGTPTELWSIALDSGSMNRVGSLGPLSRMNATYREIGNHMYILANKRVFKTSGSDVTMVVENVSDFDVDRDNENDVYFSRGSEVFRKGRTAPIARAANTIQGLRLDAAVKALYFITSGRYLEPNAGAATMRLFSVADDKVALELNTPSREYNASNVLGSAENGKVTLGLACRADPYTSGYSVAVLDTKAASFRWLFREAGYPWVPEAAFIHSDGYQGKSFDRNTSRYYFRF
jgi:hypothetical protein